VAEPDVNTVPACSRSCGTPSPATQAEDDCPDLLGWSLLLALPFPPLSLSSPLLMLSALLPRTPTDTATNSRIGSQALGENSTHSQRWQTGVVSRTKDRPATGPKPLRWTLIRRGGWCCCTTSSFRMSLPVAQSWALSPNGGLMKAIKNLYTTKLRFQKRGFRQEGALVRAFASTPANSRRREGKATSTGTTLLACCYMVKYFLKTLYPANMQTCEWNSLSCNGQLFFRFDLCVGSTTRAICCLIVHRTD